MSVEYGPQPVACADCGAALQEVGPRSVRWPRGHPPLGGRSVWRCPWTKAGRSRVEFADGWLTVLTCDWPKGYVDKRGQPLKNALVRP